MRCMTSGVATGDSKQPTSQGAPKGRVDGSSPWSSVNGLVQGIYRKPLFLHFFTCFLLYIDRAFLQIFLGTNSLVGEIHSAHVLSSIYELDCSWGKPK